MVVSSSEHVWKGSKDTKHWPHVHVSGVSARTCFTHSFIFGHVKSRAEIDAISPADINS